MEDTIKFTFSFDGNEAEQHRLDLYDVSKALEGFHRTLALTTHLIINNEVITQAPSLKNATIYSLPPEEGSWKITVIVCTTLFSLGTAPKDTPLGHLIYSAYDYVISESLGVHIDYNKTLGKIYEESKAEKLPKIREHQLDSIIEKCSNSIKEMHRPIYKTNTATKAEISAKVHNETEILSTSLDYETYMYIKTENINSKEVLVHGYISSYNINTFTGRIYTTEVNRAVPFELSYYLKNERKIIKLIVNSLRESALKVKERKKLKCLVQKVESVKGKLKKYIIISMSIERDTDKED